MSVEESKYCRLCKAGVREIIYLCDSPPANNFDDTFSNKQAKAVFPLAIDFCDSCFNIQLRHCLGEELLYSNYSYITPTSNSLDEHYQRILSYVEQKIGNLLSTDVVELGSNNGELLKFLKPKVSSVLGVDPAQNIAKLANDAGVDTLNCFFNLKTAIQIKSLRKNIRLVIARHMFAHNADPSELLNGMKELLKEDGLILIENAYAIDTLMHGEFDQIYHEHMFFYSVSSMNNLLNQHGLFLCDIIFSEVHGGSIGFIASKKDIGQSQELKNQLLYEKELFHEDKIFKIFIDKIESVKNFVLTKLAAAQMLNKTIGAYGAPAKAFTMFSLLGIDSSSIKFCVDTSPTKIGKTFPISNIPIISESTLKDQEYDILLVTSWNYKKDILSKSDRIFKPGTTLIFPLPEPSEVLI